MTYISGFVVPVAGEEKDAYVESARRAWPLFRDYGAVEHVEGWGDDVPHGETTDFHRAVAATDEETVVFSWVRWPDKATADRCEESMETDSRWKEIQMPPGARRMIVGGFEVVFEERS